MIYHTNSLTSIPIFMNSNPIFHGEIPFFNPYPTQVDDDQRYGPLLLESLLRAMGPAPGRAIGAATQHPGSGIFVFFGGKTP